MTHFKFRYSKRADVRKAYAAGMREGEKKHWLPPGMAAVHQTYHRIVSLECRIDPEMIPKGHRRLQALRTIANSLELFLEMQPGEDCGTPVETYTLRVLRPIR